MTQRLLTNDVSTIRGDTHLRYFCVDGTDHPTHAEQASIIRRYIRWRNNNAADKALNDIVNHANVC